jgi:polar amino acid transport system substrate-binding protein
MLPVALTAAAVLYGMSGQLSAQAPAGIAQQLAPTGKLRVGVLMLNYFVREEPTTRRLTGVIPELGGELARRAGVQVELVKIPNPGTMLQAFRDGALDVTFFGITADRAAVVDFGPTVIDLETSFLVPAGSPFKTIPEVDQTGVRILIPSRSAQEAQLKKIFSKATLINVAVETPKQATARLAAGEADVFSHVVPMLLSAQPDLPGSRILPGSYFNVPVSIAYAKGRGPAVADLCRDFVTDVTASGFTQRAIDRMGDRGVIVHRP